MKKYWSIFILTIFSSSLFAEKNIAESMHENGKIYPVIAVVAVIFIGIIIFLIRQEKKLNRLEKQIQDK